MSLMSLAVSVASHSTRVSTRVFTVYVCFVASGCVKTAAENVAVAL